MQIGNMVPNSVTHEGGAKVIIVGNGFFDTVSKKIMFATEFGERLVDLNWDKKDRSFNFVAPPINWYYLVFNIYICMYNIVPSH